MKIAVLGAGNLGCALSVLFSQGHEVFLYSHSHRAQKYIQEMELYNEDTDQCIKGRIERITDSLTEAIIDAAYVFITFPAFMFKSFSEELIPLLCSGQHLVFVPGSGGAELIFKEAIDKQCIISGLQRVHGVVRIIESGRLVKQSGIRKSIRVATVPSCYNNEVCSVLADLFHITVEPLQNYLNITLINSNPILHSSRLYSVFKDYPDVAEYKSLPLFYEEWDIPSSELLISMDKELFLMIHILKENHIEVDEIIPILNHYESHDAVSLTKKIRSIKSLRGLTTPAVLNDNGMLCPDVKSRYFTADFSFGLDILLAFSDVLGTENTVMNRVSDWYHRFISDTKRFSLTQYGINSIEDIRKMYCS